MTSKLTDLPEWQALVEHQRSRAFDLRELFAREPARFERYHIQHESLLLDFSKHYLTAQTLPLLVGLADTRRLREWIDRLMRGERINNTEKRAVLHTALRANTPVMLEGRDVTRDVASVRLQMRAFSEALRSGEVKGASGRAITDVVNIGIGGSDLGPALAVEALAPYAAREPRVHFMSNIDGAHVEAVLKDLDPHA